jgi:acyl transferase domain-containing protein
MMFMFSGQDSQYIDMGKHFYRHETIFRDAADRCAEILRPFMDIDLRQAMYPTQENDETAVTLLRQTQYIQPTLFAIEYALAQLWESWGVRPANMIGHNIEEFVAACLSGVCSLKDGLELGALVATRACMMGKLPKDSMLSVRLTAKMLEKHLSNDLEIVAINGPSLCIVSGLTDEVANLQQCSESKEVVCCPLYTSYAFHSLMMNCIIEPFVALVKTIQLSPPQIPFVSTQTLWQQSERVLLEIYPCRTTTATLEDQQAKDLKRQIAISSLSSNADDDTKCAAILQAISQLWLARIGTDKQAFYADEYQHQVPLPTYAFKQKCYWIDPKPTPDAILKSHPSHQVIAHLLRTGA